MPHHTWINPLIARPAQIKFFLPVCRTFNRIESDSIYAMRGATLFNEFLIFGKLFDNTRHILLDLNRCCHKVTHESEVIEFVPFRLDAAIIRTDTFFD